MTEQYLTPREIESDFGEQLRRERLRQNISMKELTERAGISLQALRGLEQGTGSRVNTLIRVLNALGKVAWLETFSPRVQVNPLDLAKGIQVRQRSSKSRNS